MKSSSALALIVGLSLTVAACAQPQPVEEVVGQAQEAEVEEAPIIPRHPLTGSELNGATVTGPSIAIKIDNTSDGRPQVGITEADMVFEELVEGGVTRYLAVYHSDIPDEVGPVRSGRPQDSDLVASLGGIFVFSGVGNDNVREIIRRSGLQLVEDDRKNGTPYVDFLFRSKRKPGPFNLHIEAAKLAEFHAELASPVEQFSYVTDPSQASAFVDGEDASSLRVTFSKRVQSIWEWDEPTQTYLKFLSNGSPDVDAEGIQISATNLLIFTPNYYDVEGLPTAQISGTKEGLFVATGGKIVLGIFDATVFGEPILLTYGDNQPVLLSPGKSFILLPPGAGSQATGVNAGNVAYTSNGAEVVLGI